MPAKAMKATKAMKVGESAGEAQEEAPGAQVGILAECTNKDPEGHKEANHR